MRCQLTLLLAAGLLLAAPAQARACDPNCNIVAGVLLGVPTALVTTVVAPLIGSALDGRDNSPYWTALGFTAAASSLGVAVAIATGSGNGDDGQVIRAIGLPAAFGVLATVLVYSRPRREPEAPPRRGEIRQGRTPTAVPLLDGRHVGVQLRF
jgi:hypothetical protein